MPLLTWSGMQLCWSAFCICHWYSMSTLALKKCPKAPRRPWDTDGSISSWPIKLVPFPTIWSIFCPGQVRPGGRRQTCATHKRGYLVVRARGWFPVHCCPEALSVVGYEGRDSWLEVTPVSFCNREVARVPPRWSFGGLLR
uniref:Secreted protein n=1 Tax=Phlegmariurus squarrosus TaxID=73615 RepID=H9M863_PHLSQ|nr:hypothetical protein HusqMp83 [Phlegmariurus squarrosus]AEV55770.1 hypothetical protein HusqMp83 [Phlegmariurus squarrosus]